VGKFVVSEAAMLTLRRSRRFRKLWTAPLMYSALGSAHGAIHNALNCY